MEQLTLFEDECEDQNGIVLYADDQPAMAVEPDVYIDCPRCARRAIQDRTDPHICVDCARAENVRYSHIRQHQNDWMLVAKEAGIDIWMQQPSETQWEYTVWVAYRDSFPGKKPSYKSVAEQLLTTYAAVKRVAQRWSFQARMQAWMAECERITLLQRRNEILEMNKDHVDMAKALRGKLSAAITRIDPNTLKPAEIATLARVSTEMERKARLDTIEQEVQRNELVADNSNPDIKKQQTKQGDLPEILKVLVSSGAIKEITHIGVRQTTEMVMLGKEDE